VVFFPRIFLDSFLPKFLEKIQSLTSQKSAISEAPNFKLFSSPSNW